MGYSFKFKDLDFDFSSSKYLNYSDFMLSEFFNASQEIKTKFRRAYAKLYGIGPYNYMMNNYWYSWEYGSRIVSNTQSDRIFHIMLELLDEKAKHRLGMNEFMISIKSTVSDFLENQVKTYSKIENINKTEGIAQVFQNELNKIISLKLINKYNRILTEDEQNEALEISRYILKIKLQKAFDKIERDFNLFLPYLLNFKRGTFLASFTIDLFNLKIDITKMKNEDIEIPKFKINDIEVNSRFKYYSDKYLAHELLTINKDSNVAICNSFLNKNDIELFYAHYVELLKGESEINMNSTFQGQSGILLLNLKMRTFKLIKKSIILSSLKLFIFFFIIIIALFLTFKFELNNLAINCILFFILYLIVIEIKELIVSTKEFKIHGE